MQIDLNVYPGTRISKTHPFIRPFAVLAREITKPLKKYTKEKISYKGDGMTTNNNCNFLYTEKFKKAYAKSCRSHGTPFMMIQWRIHQALWCASISKSLEGDIAEFGTANGLIMSAVLEVYEDWENSNKRLILVDTFSPYDINNSTGKQDANQGINPWFAKSLEYVKSNFSSFNNVEFVVGSVPEILPSVHTNKLSFVHIDMNSAVPETAALEFCWEKLVKGGVVLLDDYACGGHTEQYNAMNLLAKKLDFEIFTTPTGQGIIVK